ncbi:MAG: response regulator [Ardenticatenaceae bacterium]|nr:response regulator [Anaerolineales bacterium]MCB9008649.1 response regulator [Ardenticatenaceae bacterium]
MSQLAESTALIIEDDPDLVQIFSQALTLSGYQTHPVSDGNQALEWLAEFVPDVVVLDLHLPGVSGRTILGKIRGDGRLANTRIILATADHLTADELRDSADLVLLKPISFKQLRDLSSRLRQKRNATDHDTTTQQPQNP